MFANVSCLCICIMCFRVIPVHLRLPAGRTKWPLWPGGTWPTPFVASLCVFDGGIEEDLLMWSNVVLSYYQGWPFCICRGLVEGEGVSKSSCQNNPIIKDWIVLLRTKKGTRISFRLGAEQEAGKEAICVISFCTLLGWSTAQHFHCTKHISTHTNRERERETIQEAPPHTHLHTALSF